MGKLRKIGKFYTRIIMRNIGIFIFVGIMSVVFHDHGWFPNEDMYAISQLVYLILIPTMIAYEGGMAIGGTNGGILGLLAISGVLVSDMQVGFAAALVMGPLCGLLWKHMEHWLETYAASSLQMLVRNLCLGVTGLLFAVGGHYFLIPALNHVLTWMFSLVRVFADHHMIGALSIIIEPAKIFFLNNVLNHSVLVPLGMAELQEGAGSIFFLLESNPGPGIGMLLALYLADRKSRKNYAAALFAHGIGGIHEVYFPFVWSNLKLLLPLILGGMAGDTVFEFLHTGTQGVVSPGSLIIVLLMAGKSSWISAFVGIVVSTLVSFCGCMLLLRKKASDQVKNTETTNIKTKNIETNDIEANNTETNHTESDDIETKNIETIKYEIKHIEKKTVTKEINAAEETAEKIEKQDTEDTVYMKIHKVGFVCDAGVGSSAMGAALLRRMLAGSQIDQVEVAAYGADMIPDDINLIVCQENFKHLLPEKNRSIETITVENLVNTAEFSKIIERIKKAR